MTPITDAIRKLAETCADCYLESVSRPQFQSMKLKVPQHIFDRLHFELFKTDRAHWTQLEFVSEATSITVGWIEVTPQK